MTSLVQLLQTHIDIKNSNTELSPIFPFIRLFYECVAQQRNDTDRPLSCQVIPVAKLNSFEYLAPNINTNLFSNCSSMAK